MPYLGNAPAEAYSQISYQDLTGGSGTSFTLDYPAGSAGEIEVFVNNVRQEPTVAYTVSGTSLTMTGSISATDDFYVVFQGKAQQTIGIPEKQANGDYNFDSNTLFIDSSASSVGVGTATPSSVLDVEVDQDAETNIELTNTNTGSSAQVRTKYTTDGGLFTVGKTSNAHVYGGDAYIYNVDNTNIRFATNDTERLRILSSGGITFNGDTAAANALNDYEQGNWTATLTGTSSITNTQGFYTKIGRVVYFNYYSDAITSSSAVSANVGGLPFNCISGTNAYTAVYTAHNTWCPTATGGYVNEGGSTIALTAPGSINTAQTASSGTTYIMIAGWYLTSS